MTISLSRSARAIATALPAALLLLAPVARAGGQAQATTGIIRGQVSDTLGAPIAGAAITLKQLETNITRAVRSNESGVYAGTLLPLGTYEVTARAIGYQGQSKTGIALRLGAVVEQPFRLVKRATELAGVTITDKLSTPVNTSKTDVSQQLTEQAVKGIPNNGRNFLALTTLTPGVAITQGPDGDVLSVAGQRGIYNNVAVDGADFNNPFFGEQRGGQRPVFTFNLDAVQELSVTAHGANAEFGRSAGGFVNVVTKSGTNEFKGTVHYFGKDGGLSGDLTGAAGNTFSPDFRQHQFGFTWGGPIIRDKLFFFTAYDQQVYSDIKQKNRPGSVQLDSLKTFLASSPALGGALGSDFGAIKRSNDAQVFLAKVDWRINDRNLLSLKYNFTNSEQLNGTFDVDTWGASSNGVEKSFSNALSGQLTTQVNDAISNEFRFQLAREDRPRDYTAPGLPSGRKFPDTGMDFGSAFRIGQPFFLPVVYNDTRVQLLDNVTWSTGNHLIKVGGEANIVASNQTFIGFANGRFIFSSVTGFRNYVTQGNNYVECSNGSNNTTGACPGGSSITGPVLLYLQQAGVNGRTVQDAGTQSIPQTDLALFIQDTWKPMPTLTVNYGVRWEAEIQPDPLTAPSSVFFSPLIGGTFHGRAFPSDGTIPSDMAMFQPRLGIAWDIDGDGTQVARFSAGVYNARVAALSFASVRSTNGSIGQTLFRNSALTGVLGAPPAYTSLLTPPAGTPFRPDVFVVDKDFRNPRTWSYTASYERLLVEGITGSVTATYAQSDRLTRFVNRNDAVFYPGGAGDGPFTTALGGGNGIGTLTTVESSAQSKYAGLTFGLARRNASNYLFDVNYTYSKDKSDDDNERDPFTFTYAKANALASEWGYSNRDQTHRFNGYLLMKLDYGFVLNNSFSYRSATPVSEKCVGNAASGQRATSPQDRICTNGSILGRNTLRRSNEYASWDLRVSRAFNMDGGRSLEAIVEVFNVLGRNNFRDPSANGLLFNFDGTIRSGYGDPRQIQAGMKYSF